NAVLGVSRDILARKRSEKALRESERKYRSIFEHAVEGIFQCSIDGRLLSANPALANMMGYASPEEMIAEIANVEKQFYLHKEERMRLMAHLKSRGAVIGYETRMFRQDRSIIWISLNCRALLSEDSHVIYLEGSVEDITKRKQAETALVESEAKYRSVVESPLAGFFIIQENLFRFVNRRCCEITGYTYDEFVNVIDATYAIHPDDRELAEESVARCSSSMGDVVQFDARIIQKNGMIITARFFISSTLYNNAKAISGTFIDITREKGLESQLRQAQKMEAIGQLAGGIAHDFNNILTAFNGYGSILQIKMPQGDPLRIYVDQILSAAQKASSLTQNLLTFSRQQPVNLVPLDINQTILGTEKLLRRLLTEDITFTIRLSTDPVTALMDETQIDQILFNLVCNARDAMPQGGHLYLETDLVMLDDDFKKLNGFGKSGRYACISISDTGTGMSKVTKEKIFDPFFTTKELGRGTGLGLATVYGIVKQHNGYILVQSEPMQGSAFRIYLPAIKGRIEIEEAAPIELKEGWETILVAEDSDEVRAFIKDTFDMMGYRTIGAVDGEDAVRKFHETDHIDMVVLDSVMPKKNGWEVFDEISKVAPDLKALFISGYTRDVILDKGISDKEFQFLAKPLSPSTLLEKVRSILDK
ncbi:MAG: PAS domain S-box protein, partial [Syntrophales bacterium]|nr:PAS domain S-box protein [Syntrophales bacterium]